LTRFNIEIEQVAKRYRAANDGYLMAFATRLDKQGQHYGKPLMEALLSHLDATGEGCYLETLKAENVDLYEHFSFELKEHINMHLGNLPLYAMHRPGGKLLHFR
jgi:GNAT superfamily N-acetyltransferase